MGVVVVVGAQGGPPPSTFFATSPISPLPSSPPPCLRPPPTCSAATAPARARAPPFPACPALPPAPASPPAPDLPLHCAPAFPVHDTPVSTAVRGSYGPPGLPVSPPGGAASHVPHVLRLPGAAQRQARPPLLGGLPMPARGRTGAPGGPAGAGWGWDGDPCLPAPPCSACGLPPRRRLQGQGHGRGRQGMGRGGMGGVREVRDEADLRICLKTRIQGGGQAKRRGGGVQGVQGVPMHVVATQPVCVVIRHGSSQTV